jgi:hypothetical protein
MFMSFGGSVNQWSDWHDRVQQPSRRRQLSPTVPPQWQDDTPSQESYRPRHNHAAPRYQAVSAPQTLPRQQISRKPVRKRSVIFLAAAGVASIGFLCTILSSGSGRSVISDMISSRTSAQPSGITQAEKACPRRSVASGGIYVRMVRQGASAHAKRLAAEWGWDYSAGKCLTSMQMAIATAPQSAGDCTQVGYVTRNRAYDAKARSASPLPHVAAEAGPACQNSDR